VAEFGGEHVRLGEQGRAEVCLRLPEGGGELLPRLARHQLRGNETRADLDTAAAEVQERDRTGLVPLGEDGLLSGRELLSTGAIWSNADDRLVVRPVNVPNRLSATISGQFSIAQ
jgi:hypothetical protein